MDEAVVVYFVVVEEGATGGFANADRFQGVDSGVGADALGEDVGVIHEDLDVL